MANAKKELIEVSFMAHKPDKSKPKTMGVLSLNVEEVVGDMDKQPMDIIAVLDVSSSMSGEKIKLLKETMHFVADCLTEEDRLCIVSFSSAATRITPLVPLGNSNCKSNKHMTNDAIRNLRAQGCTNISSGMAYAFKHITDRRHCSPITSVFLLTDGQNNTGRDPYTYIQEMITSMGIADVIIHTFG